MPAAVFLYSLVYLQSLIRLKADGRHEYDSAIIGYIGKHCAYFIGFFELVYINAAHFNKAALGQERHTVDRFLQRQEREIALIKPPVAEIIGFACYTELFYLIKKSVGKVILGPPDKIQPGRSFDL